MDVGQKLDYDAFMAYARLEERADASTREDMRELWVAVRHPRHDKQTRGPIARMHERDKSVGGVLRGQFGIAGSTDKFEHRVRDALRRRETKRIVTHKRMSATISREKYTAKPAQTKRRIIQPNPKRVAKPMPNTKICRHEEHTW